MNLTRASVFFLLPPAVALERFAYYGLRATLMGDLVGAAGLDGDEAMATMRNLTWMTLATPLLGGLVAMALKPRWTLVAGAALSAAGYAAVAAAGPANVIAGFPLLALGLGLFRPALFASAALPMRDPVETGRSALFVALYAAANLAALLAPPVAQAVRRGTDPASGIAASLGGVLLTLCAILALAAALAPRLDELPAPSDPRFTGRGELGAAAVIALVFPASLTLDLATGLQFAALRPSEAWVYSLNPVVALAVASFVLLALAGAAFAGKRVPAPYLAAGGMVLAASGCLPLAATGLLLEESLVRVAALASIVMMAAAEVLVYPLALGRIAAAAHPRLSTLAAAVWIAASGGVSQLLLAFRTGDPGAGDHLVPGVLLAAAAVVTLLAAAGLALLQWTVAERLWGAASPGEGDREPAVGPLPAGADR